MYIFYSYLLRCDKSTATCQCPFGWTVDPLNGPCGKLVINTSDWQGLGRCPGVVTYSSNTVSSRSTFSDASMVQNYHDRIWVSMNPQSNATGRSAIYYYTWNPIDQPIALLSSRFKVFLSNQINYMTVYKNSIVFYPTKRFTASVTTFKF